MAFDRLRMKKRGYRKTTAFENNTAACLVVVGSYRQQVDNDHVTDAVQLQDQETAKPGADHEWRDHHGDRDGAGCPSCGPRTCGYPWWVHGQRQGVEQTNTINSTTTNINSTVGIAPKSRAVRRRMLV